MPIVMFAAMGGNFFKSEYSNRTAVTTVASTPLNLWLGLTPSPYNIRSQDLKPSETPSSVGFVVFVTIALLGMVNPNVALAYKALTTLA